MTSRKNYLITAFFSALILFSTISYSYADSTEDFYVAYEFYVNDYLDQSKVIFERLAKEGNPESYYYLALIARKSGESNDQVVNKLRIATDHGSASAMLEMSNLYKKGEGVKQDLLKAQDWLRKSELANAQSTYKNAIYFNTDDNGESVEITPEEMLQLIIKQAVSGSISAQYQAAHSYDIGVHGVKDSQKALKWYKTAAENGQYESGFILGYFYCRGIHVKKDINKSNNLFKKIKSNIVCK